MDSEKKFSIDDHIEKTKRGFFGFFINRQRLTILLTLMILVMGTLGLINLPRESDPEVKIPIAIVTTVYPGASPADVENLITDTVEGKIEELTDLHRVTSSSVLGLSSIVVEFDARADLEKSIRDLKDKVAEVTDLPDEATTPMVTPIRANDQAIITFSFAGDLDAYSFKQLGETIQDELEKIPNVSDVPLHGVHSREFLVTTRSAELDRLGLSISQVVGAIASSNLDTPLGNITIDGINYNLRAVAKFDSIEDLKQVIVGAQGSTPIYLTDVADVVDQLSEPTTLARLSLDGQPATDTISLQLYKKTGGNVLRIVDGAKEKIQDLYDDGVIPPTVRMEISNDFSQFIRKDLSTLGSSGVQAVVLIFIVMILALSFKEAVLALLAIPITFLITFYTMFARGDTLNSLSLFALVLSLGLLVDNFIVILVGMFQNMRNGYTPKRAALLSVADFKGPMMAGTFTTIAAFVPMLLVSGILGEYLKVLPLTISAVLLASIGVSLILVPGLGALLFKSGGDKPKPSILDRYVMDHWSLAYERQINALLKNRKRKRLAVLTVTLLFFGSLGLLIGGVIPVELFPKVDIDFSYINIEMPIGTDLETTDKLVKQVENYLYARNDVKSFVTTVGSPASGFNFGSTASSNEHVANINVNFIESDQRDLKSYQINEEIRNDLKNIREGKITIEELTSGPPTGAPIEVRILGADQTVLNELSDQLVALMEDTPGVINITSNRQVSPADLTFSFRRQALAEAGLTVGDVSRTLRTAIFGVTATEVTVKGDDIDIVVEMEKGQIDSVEAISNITIPNGRGQAVKLSRLADFSLEPALAAIQHRDFQRTTTIQADLEPGYTAATVSAELEQKVITAGVPRGYTVNFGGEVEDIEQSFSELWSAMIVAVLLILFILVFEFDSFKKPLIILLTLPLATIGVVVGMLLFRLPFSFSVFLGLVSLAGIVVNNAIILIDRASRNVDENHLSPRQAVAEAARTRLQPIFLTSLTTVLGALPLALADEFWFGLSIAIAFGLVFSTFLQLFIVPIFFLKLEGKKALKQRQQSTV